MKAYTLLKYQEAGCPEYHKPDPIAVGLYFLFDGKVCDTGCNRYQDGRCPAYRKLTAGEVSDVSRKRRGVLRDTHQEETVRQEAERCGVSIKEVRRRRRDALNAKP